MSAPLTIAPGERGIVRLFAVDLPEETLRALPGYDPSSDLRAFAPLTGQLLGAPEIDTAYTELFPFKALAGLGLPAYLKQAYDISEAELAPHAAAFAALEREKPFILIVLSRATAHVPGARLAPADGVRFIARLATPKAAVSATPLTSDTGRGFIGTRGAPAPAPRPAPTRLIALAIAALAVLGIVLWLFMAKG